MSFPIITPVTHFTSCDEFVIAHSSILKHSALICIRHANTTLILTYTLVAVRNGIFLTRTCMVHQISTSIHTVMLQYPMLKPLKWFYLYSYSTNTGSTETKSTIIYIKLTGMSYKKCFNNILALTSARCFSSYSKTSISMYMRNKSTFSTKHKH